MAVCELVHEEKLQRAGRTKALRAVCGSMANLKCHGLRREAQRHAAFAGATRMEFHPAPRPPESGIAAPLCHRSPRHSAHAGAEVVAPASWSAAALRRWWWSAIRALANQNGRPISWPLVAARKLLAMRKAPEGWAHSMTLRAREGVRHRATVLEVRFPSATPPLQGQTGRKCSIVSYSNIVIP